MPARVRILAPAKVNLRLAVLAREASGYHGLETIFCALALADRLEVERTGEGVALEQSGGVDTGPAGENLAVRAARGFLAASGAPGGVVVRLEKRIPAAAGLGGGSSDAAATLLAMNSLFGAPLARPTLLRIAVELGSDVPFFLCGSPYALAWSRGERLLALPPLPPRPVLVAHPGVAMPTAGAFARIAQLRGPYAPAAEALDLRTLGSWDGVARLARNDFGPVAEEAVPRLGAAFEALRRAGAGIALLAGSGASVFGVFGAGGAIPDGLESRLHALGFGTWRTTTLDAMPVPDEVAG